MRFDVNVEKIILRQTMADWIRSLLQQPSAMERTDVPVITGSAVPFFLDVLDVAHPSGEFGTKVPTEVNITTYDSKDAYGVAGYYAHRRLLSQLVKAAEDFGVSVSSVRGETLTSEPGSILIRLKSFFGALMRV